jgi:transcription antitermination protein NusB
MPTMSDDREKASTAAGVPRRQGAARSARHRSREFALQGLYGWLLSGGEAREIAARFGQADGFAQADEPYFLELLGGSISSADALREQFAEAIDRRVDELSPVEHSILLIATWELVHRPEIPYRVVINEAVELAKSFGATEGYRYVNGVLDRLAGRLRAAETSRPAAR